MDRELESFVVRWKRYDLLLVPLHDLLILDPLGLVLARDELEIDVLV